MDNHFESREITLRDGRSVLLRAVASSDESEILQAFDRLGGEARYMRFMRAVGEVNRDRLRGVLASFPEQGFSIAATVPAADGCDIVGAASFFIGPDPRACEFAITVSDAWAGAGLGGELLGALIGVARRRGLREMTGFVLAGNGGMLRLASRLGFEVTADPEDIGLRLCRLPLEPGA